MVVPAYVKAVSIPDDVRKGLTPDQLENTGVSTPKKSMEITNGKWFHLNLMHINCCLTLG